MARDARRRAARDARGGGGSDDDDEPADAGAAAAACFALLEEGETVASAIRRVGRTLKARAPGAAEAFDALTAAADALVGAGRTDVYETTREALAAAAAPAPAAAAARAGDARRWEYRAADGAVYGPYDTQTILDWRAAGYFAGDGGVPMRLYAEPPPPRAVKDELAADLADSDDEAPPPANPNRWAHSDDIDFLGDGAESPL